MRKHERRCGADQRDGGQRTQSGKRLHARGLVRGGPSASRGEPATMSYGIEEFAQNGFAFPIRGIPAEQAADWVGGAYEFYERMSNT